MNRTEVKKPELFEVDLFGGELRGATLNPSDRVLCLWDGTMIACTIDTELVQAFSIEFDQCKLANITDLALHWCKFRDTELPNSVEKLRISNMTFRANIPDNLRVLHIHNAKMMTPLILPSTLECLIISEWTIPESTQIPATLKEVILYDDETPEPDLNAFGIPNAKITRVESERVIPQEYRVFGI